MPCAIHLSAPGRAATVTLYGHVDGAQLVSALSQLFSDATRRPNALILDARRAWTLGLSRAHATAAYAVLSRSGADVPARSAWVLEPGRMEMRLAAALLSVRAFGGSVREFSSYEAAVAWAEAKGSSGLATSGLAQAA